jgi:hypothetical protein
LVLAAEILLIVALFFVLAGTPPPDVNESHYLTKARHYWDPAWCPHDPFLNSADAHLVFYWVFGWLTRLCSLSASAWIGRLVTWTLLAWSWQRLTAALLPKPGYALLTAAVFVTLTQWGHLAGEWVIGGVEAKGFAYVLLFLALESLVRSRWRAAVVLAGAATAIHVLVGGWSLIALAWTWCWTERAHRPATAGMWPALIAAGALSLLGLIPGLALTWSVDPEVLQEANRIYVFERLSHHLVFHDFPHRCIARHAALALGWVAMIRWLPRIAPDRAAALATLNRFVAAAVVIAIAGVLLDQMLLGSRPLAAWLLRFYWFRLTDVMVPVGATMALAAWLEGLARSRPQYHAWALAAVLLAVSASVAQIAGQHLQNQCPGALTQGWQVLGLSAQESMQRQRDWQRVCEWIERHTRPDDVFLTPRHQQTFKWYAGRSEVICAKDIPQDAVGIVDWRNRLEDVFPWSVGLFDLAAHGDEGLMRLAKKYGFEYVIIDRGVSSAGLGFPRVYPSSGNEASIYEVYLVPATGPT